ncbi:hypothetical protein BD324DRAFT_631343 [Kockovaella imperatae]|uniref:CFEM domain-containing protein n=1 Tax=Kockovaella imperatae TaxID=4999 RepID=A0A1Y1UCD2_9TREE|nr:hypothetical protein BD324DRAFT_631343 [Kockovaella imperatae]ORX35708.1 hypothetical protein BD324DRAFT_631343 [Kockovaella imperatae]
MLFSHILTAASVACTVQAGLLRFRQSASVPNCAVNCLNDAATRSGSQCSSSNVTCLCFDPMVSGYLLSCLGGSCPTAEANEGQQYFRDQCEAGQAFTATSSSGSSTSSSLASFMSTAASTTETDTAASTSSTVTSSESASASTSSSTTSNAPSTSRSEVIVTSTSTASNTPPTTLAQVTSQTQSTEATTVVTVIQSASASNSPATTSIASNTGSAIPNSFVHQGVAAVVGIAGALLFSV